MNMNFVRVAVGVAVAAGVGFMGYKVVTTVKKETDKMAVQTKNDLGENLYSLKTMAAIFGHEFTADEEKLIEKAEKLLTAEKPDFVDLIDAKNKIQKLLNTLVKQHHPEEKKEEAKAEETKSEGEQAKAA